MNTTIRISLILLTVTFTSTWARAAKESKLTVLVIHAHNKNKSIDKKLEDLAEQFKALKFKGYALKDQVEFSLAKGATSRLQLPNKAWMNVTSLGLDPDGKLKLELEIKKAKFRTKASVAAGATLAVGGPPFDGGSLILALRRPHRLDL